MGIGNDSIRINLSKTNAKVISVHNARPTMIGHFVPRVIPGKPYAITIMRRGTQLCLLHDDTILFDAQLPRAAGTKAGIALDHGWLLEDARVQPLEPVVFSDDFMRTSEERGAWQAQRGMWRLRSAVDSEHHGLGNHLEKASYASNVFSLQGSSASDSALYTAGQPFWEDYTFTVAVRPAAQGAVGVMVNMSSPEQGILARWTPANDHRPAGNKLIIYRVNGKQLTQIAESPGGYVPGIWYKFSVSSTWGALHVAIDDRERIAITNPTPMRGGIGLYAEGQQASEFYDVVVYGHGLNTDRIEELQREQIDERFQNDKNGMQSWLNLDGWKLLVAIPPHWVSRNDYQADQYITLTVTPSSQPGGALWLVVNGDGETALSGYRAVIEQQSAASISYTLYKNAQSIAMKTGPLLAADTEYTFRLERKGNRISLTRDGAAILTATDASPLSGKHPAYRAIGRFAQDAQVQASDNKVLDYMFTQAPVDWQTEGTWRPTVRWACDPSWSFLGGWSRGDAVLWYKKRFSGDHALQVFLGLNMEYPRERESYEQRYRDFCLTICGTGWNPRSGYTAIYGAEDQHGGHNLLVLLRDGIRIAGKPIVMPTRQNAHHQWFNLALHKEGNRVVFSLDGETVLAYDDPYPIAGGIPAVWTSDNSICVARIRLRFVNPPLHRSDLQVGIDELNSPEWMNVRQTLHIDFQQIGAVSGKPVNVQVIPLATPPGEEGALRADAKGVTFQPMKQGEYWYQLFATDGQYRSAKTNLSLPVFNPSLARDDSHALVLYRFAEGKGNIVHDLSRISPPADLQISNPAHVSWLPGHGLLLHHDVSLRTATNTDKLLSIAKTHAFTLECWLSADTLYPSTEWIACLLAWEKNATQQNLAIGYHFGNLDIPPQQALAWGSKNAVEFSGFHNGFQHVVVTWDGIVTRVYMNGKSIGEAHIDWQPEQWVKDAPLIIGNQFDGKYPFPGALYLLAIHDRAFTENDVLRNYQAGPDAEWK